MKKILLYGAGPMAVEYAKVLLALNKDFDVIGRGEASAKLFEEKTGKKVLLDTSINSTNYSSVIVAVSMEQLGNVTRQLIENNFKTILVEKPGGLNAADIQAVSTLATEKNATVLLAYNRRFYASTLAAEKIIAADGGIISMHFEFTEWSHVIEPLPKAEGVKENWFLGNSTHVVDLAFYLGGNAKEISCYKSGSLSWHPSGAAFVGSGITDKNILFSYNANWNAPGRWGVELMTANHRLILRPMEKLQVQKKGSVAIEEVLIDDILDKDFKPGLYLQTQSFLQNDFSRFSNIRQQAENANGVYSKMMS
ncbi:MAG: hypothetical protein RL065_1829 [Bacteroidota bacterium]|jgi:predicted dehydrogenase